MGDGFIPRHGGFRGLKSYQKSLIVFQGTKHFCRRFFAGDRRQTDQMVQAARSGKQNIVEGSVASATSKEVEIRLTNVAKASQDELREDFEDFLHDRGLPEWDSRHPKARELSARSRVGEETYDKYRADIESASAEVSANTLRHLAIQTIYLLDRQVKRLERDFLQAGGIKERMVRARVEARDLPPNADQRCPPPTGTSPSCPECGKPMRRRTARRGPNAGSDFWGCSGFPDCRGTRPLEERTVEDREDGRGR
jgi:four helix bundle suffix protein